MPPKRKAAGGAKGKGGKKAKVEEPEAPATMKDAAEKLKAEDKKSGGKKSHKVDSLCPLFGGSVSDMVVLYCYLLHSLPHNPYHTIPTFNKPKSEGFRNYCGKRRKCWKPAFSPFSTIFSIPYRTKLKI